MISRATSYQAGVLAFLAIAAVATALPARAQHGDGEHSVQSGQMQHAATQNADGPLSDHGASHQDADVQGGDGRGVNYNHIIHMAGQQRMRSQEIANVALLIALGHDGERRRQSLDSSRAQFERALSGLRRGDEDMMLPPTSDPLVLERLDHAESVWRELDTLLNDGLTNEAFTTDQVSRIADISATLRMAAEDMVDSYLNMLRDGRLHSMLTVAVDTSSRQQMLVEQMTSDFLLIAYGYHEQAHRQELVETVARFDRTIVGLIHGDLELLLLPAPTPLIREQLRLVERIWRDEFEPLMRRAIAGDTLLPEEIASAARLNQTLVNEIEPAVVWYHML